MSVWQQGIEIVKAVYKLSQMLPDTEKYCLRDQMQRSAVSIPSNIAEGCGRGSNPEFKRFLHIAIGSSFELSTQLLLIQELGLVDPKEVKPIIEALDIEQKRINKLIILLKANG